MQDFLRLFLNHRPARGEDTAQLEKVFKVIGKDQMEDPSEVPDISRQQLISFLKNHGEFFKDRDFHQHIKILFSGTEPVGEEEEHNEFFHIPEQVTYKDFVSDALKLPSLLTCRGDLSKVDHSSTSASNLQLVIDEEEPPIKA